MKMKVIFIKLFILIFIIFICDEIFGIFMNYVINHIEVGGQAKDNYICNVAKEDIMIFGSSRAARHYNSQLLEDSLGMTCYNCGEDGNGIILAYGRLKMVNERKKPKIIIVDILPKFDVFKNDNHRYLGWLKPHYNRDGIPDIFEAIDKTERYKLKCNFYKYNSKFLQNIIVFLTGLSANTGIKGFRPIKEEFNPMKANEMGIDTKEIDPLKVYFINQFIQLSKGAKIYFVISPVWNGMDSTYFEPIKKICDNNNIPFIDFSNSKKYCHNNKYFESGYHLNFRGADEFTKDLIDSIKQ